MRLLCLFILAVALHVEARLLDPASPPNPILDSLAPLLHEKGVDVARNLNAPELDPGKPPRSPRLGLLVDVPPGPLADSAELNHWEQAFAASNLSGMAILPGSTGAGVMSRESFAEQDPFLQAWFQTAPERRIFFSFASADSKSATRVSAVMEELGLQTRLFQQQAATQSQGEPGRFYATAGQRWVMDSRAARTLEDPAQELALLGREQARGRETVFPASGKASRYYARNEPRRFRKVDLGDQQTAAVIPEIVVSGGIALGESAEFDQPVSALLFSPAGGFSLVLESGAALRLPRWDLASIKACFDFALRSQRIESDAIVDVDERRRVKMSSAFRDTQLRKQLIDVDEEPFRHVRHLDAIKSVIIDERVQIISDSGTAGFSTDYEIRFINPGRRKLAETRAALVYRYDSRTDAVSYLNSWGPDAYRINAVDHLKLGTNTIPAAQLASWSALFRAVESGAADFSRGRYEFLKLGDPGSGKLNTLPTTQFEAMHLCLDELGPDTEIGCNWLIDNLEDRRSPLMANAWLRRGIIRDLDGAYAAAVADYSQALKLASHEVRIYQYRGAAWGRLDRHRKAIRDYNKVLKAMPERAETWFYRGHAYFMLDNYEKAISDYSRAIELDPYFYRAFNNRGHSQVMLGNCAAALPDFDAAIELQPEYALAYANRADCRYEQGDYSGAIADHEQSIHFQPDNADLYNNSCWTRARIGHGAEAMEDCDMAIRLSPETPQFYDSRALAWYRQGQLERAMQDAERSMEAPNWENHLMRAAIYQSMGEQESARRDYRKARKLMRDKSRLQQRAQLLGLQTTDF